MSLIAGRYALRNIMDATIRDFNTGNVLFRINYGTTGENDWKANQTVVKGGAGAPTRIVFNDSKESTLKISTEIFTMPQLAMLAGATVQSGATNLFYHEVLTVTEDTSTTPSTMEVTLTKAPVSVTGAATVTATDVYAVQYVNGVQGQSVTVQSVDSTSKKVVLTGVTAGQEVEVYYQWLSDVSTQQIIFDSMSFPQYVEIIGDSLLVDEQQGSVAACQVHFYKAKAQPNFKLMYNATGNATQLDLMFDIMPKEINGKPRMSTFTLYQDPQAPDIVQA